MRPSSLRRFVTPILAAGFAGFTMAAVVNPLFTTPQPAGASVPVVSSVSYSAHYDLTAADLHAAEASAMARHVRYELRREAYRHWRAWHKAQLAAAATVTVTTSSPASSSYPVAHGDYSYSQLEALWSAAGGPSPATAACIAEHESSGNPDANNGAGDLGLWQVATSHDPGGNLFSPQENARVAVRVYYAALHSPYDNYDGWFPWTTAPDCGV